MIARVRNRVLSTAIAIGALGVGPVLVAGPAMAVEPLAADEGGVVITIAAAQALTFDIGPFQVESLEQIGGVAIGIDDQAESLVDPTVTDLPEAQSGAAFIYWSAFSDESTAESDSVVVDASSDLFGLNLLSVARAEGTAVCPADGAPTVDVVTEGLTILGVPATVSAEEPVASQTAPLPDDVPTPATDDGDATVDLSGIDITVTVTQSITTSETGAGAGGVAVGAAFTITGTYDGQVFTDQLIGDFVVSAVTCDSPVSGFAVTAIDPASGSTAGGETVTITGSGFTPETTVTFGDTAATSVVVDPLGDSLTAVTPAGAAGAATVTVAIPGGESGTLAYTYLAPAPSPTATPTPAPVPAAPGGRPVLAETGAAPAPLLGGALAILVAGAALAAITLIRRQRA
ncbi:IPT/TIG domain-containing protein [Herbiconiux liukaitaii]|uniref:IPT/TIG domain-containing protein n=1 Tax=Herbiconiux liukaitaii TaxID=3342799 RepID=UPI0035BB77CC